MKKSIVILFFVLLAPAAYVSADLGPKPDTFIKLTYNNQPVTGQFYVEILECIHGDKMNNLSNNALIVPQLRTGMLDKDQNCYWYPEMREIDDYSIICKNSRCNLGYLFNWYMISVYVPSLDQVFFVDLLDSDYALKHEIELNSNQVKVIKAKVVYDYKDYTIKFLIALLITLLLELLAALVCTIKMKISYKKILEVVILMNVISLPIVWYLFPLLTKDSYLNIILFSEIFVLFFEIFFLKTMFKEKISFIDAIMLSLILNITSFFFGGYVYYNYIINFI